MLDSFNACVVPIAGLSFTRKAMLKPVLSLQFPVPSLGHLQPQRKGQLALFSRHYPQPNLSTVVAPSGGVQRTQIRESGHRTTSPLKERVLTIQQERARSPRTRRHPVFSCTCPASRHLHSEGVQSTMGCKQYNRMLGLSRGYTHILYPSLNKWDAARDRRFSTNTDSRKSFRAAEDRLE